MATKRNLGRVAGAALVATALAGCVGGRGGDVYYSEPVYRPAQRVVYQEPVYRAPLRFIAQQPVYSEPAYVPPRRSFFQPRPVAPEQQIYVPARPGVSGEFIVNPYTGQRTDGAVPVPQRLQRSTLGDAPN
jgi:hypothetical protein